MANPLLVMALLFTLSELLTTERSEVVPFLRGVRKGGRVAKRPLKGAKPPLMVTRAAVGSPEFASFS